MGVPRYPHAQNDAFRDRWTLVNYPEMRRIWVSTQWVVMIGTVAGVGVYSARHAGDTHSVTDGVLLVQEVEVAGPLDVRLHEEVTALLQDLVGTPVLDVSLPEIQKRALSHPWVRSASAHRSLPGKITVDVEPRRAVALLQSKAGLQILGDHGERIHAEGVLPNVPILEASAASPQLTQFLSEWSGQTSAIIEQIQLKSHAAKLVVTYRENRIIIHTDLAQPSTWVAQLDRALDAALATAAERRLAVRYVTVIDDKKFVVKTS